ncbi:hypothetical protein Q9233_012992 [Columba guinea]|nr:hypothetical protein Q9233_012992 [Columba guinea]
MTCRACRSPSCPALFQCTCTRYTQGVGEAGAETLLGTFTYDVNKMIAQTVHAQDESGLSEAELESLRKAQGWLEQMWQLKETEDQVSAAKRNILQAVTLALEEHDIQEEKIEGVDEAGAETLLGTFTYDVNKMIAQTFHAQDESGLSEAELESLRKAQGWLEQMWQLKETEDQVSAAKRNILQAVTLALEEHDIQEEKIEGVDEAGAETLLGTFTYDVNKMIAKTFHAQDESGLSEAELESLRKAQGWLEQMRQLKETEDQVSAAKRNILQAVTLALEEHDVQEEKIEIKRNDSILPAGFYYLDSLVLGHGTLNDESGLSEAELESLRKAQGWLEQMRQLKETEDQVSAAKRNILQAVTLALEEHDVQEEKIEIKGVDEAGAETLPGTFTYDVNKMIAQTFHAQDESGLSEAELESLRKAQGWLEQMRQLKKTEDQVSAAKRNILQAVTLALEEHDVQEEKIEIKGVDEAGAETLPGTFTYDVNKMIAQTFHAQDESGLSEAELESLRKAQGWLEQMRQLKETEDQVSAAKRNILQAVTLALEEHDVQEEKIEIKGVDEAGAETLLGTFTYDVNKMIAQTVHAQGVDEAGAETLLGTFTYDVNKMIAKTFHAQQINIFLLRGHCAGPEEVPAVLATRVLGLFALCILIVFPAGFYYLDSLVLGHGTLNDESGLSEAELESLRKAQGWLEQMRQLKETEDQVSAAKRNILQAVTLALEEHDVQEEKIEIKGVDEAGAETLLGTFTYDVNKMIAQTVHAQGVDEAGAETLLGTFTYDVNKMIAQTFHAQGVDEAGAETLLGTFTYDVNKMIAQTFHAQGVDEAGAETLLGTFTYDVNKMIAQTFHAQGVDEAGAETLLGTFTYDVNKMIAQTFHAQGVDEAGAETLLGTFTYDVNKMIAQTFHAQGVDEAGAETLLGTFTYDVNKMIAQTFHAQDESGLSEAELESLRKAQGWLEQMRQLKKTEDQVSAAKRNILQAVTLALEEHDVQEEKIEIKGVDEAGAETLLGTFTYDVNKMMAKTFHAQGVDEAGAETLLGTFTYDVNKMIAQTVHAQDESGLSEAELESLRKAQGWLEQMRQLKKTEDQVSAAKRNILQAVTLALEEHDVQEEKIEIKGVDEAGAETLLGTFTYDVNKMIAQTVHAQDESGLSEAELESLRKAQGWLEQMRQLKETEDQVSAAKRNILRAVTLALEEHDVQEEKIEIKGADEAGAETLLGTFTYDVNKMMAKTFHAQDESGLSEAELESLRKAQGWLEQMRQLKETEDQVSAAKRNILQAVTLALEEHDVQEEKIEIKGVDEAGAETLLGTFTYDVNKMIAQTVHAQGVDEAGAETLLGTFTYDVNKMIAKTFHAQDESGLSEAELESLRKAQGWLEQMRQLKETEDQVSAAKRNILQAVTLALEEHDVQEEKIEIKRNDSILPAGFYYLDSLVLGHGTLNDESGLSEAELESLRKAQGWLEQMRQLKETEDQVSAAKRNILQAVTLALEEHDVQEEKIEIKGVDEAGAETLPGTFTYDVNKMIAQTFHAQSMWLAEDLSERDTLKELSLLMPPASPSEDPLPLKLA